MCLVKRLVRRSLQEVHRNGFQGPHHAHWTNLAMVGNLSNVLPPPKITQLCAPLLTFYPNSRLKPLKKGPPAGVRLKNRPDIIAFLTSLQTAFIFLQLWLHFLGNVACISDGVLNLLGWSGPIVETFCFFEFRSTRQKPKQ